MILVQNIGGGGIKDMLSSLCQNHGGIHAPNQPMIYATGGNLENKFKSKQVLQM